MVYEPNQSDDNVTPDNMVRSRFGTPRIGKNGSGPSKIPEQYRFAPDQLGGVGDELTIDGDFTTGSAKTQPPSRRRHSANNEVGPLRPAGRHSTAADAVAANGKRVSRAERRRAAEQAGDEDDYAANHSADLSRIASFLRSTQKEAAETTPAAEPDDPHAEAKTSELPTVSPPAPTPVPGPALTNEAVLSAVRQVPGVTGARLNEADNKLALEIADGADTDVVHRDVVAVLDSHLGVRARPVAPAATTVEAEPVRERSGGMQHTGRVMLERTQVITSGFESTVEVGLTVNGTRAVGRAAGPAVDRHILRSAAEATVDAVGVLVGKDARVVVESATICETGAGRVAVVLVLLLTKAGSEQLAGAAPVDVDRRQAVVHATLQALNRRLETILS